MIQDVLGSAVCGGVADSCIWRRLGFRANPGGHKGRPEPGCNIGAHAEGIVLGAGSGLGVPNVNVVWSQPPSMHVWLQGRARKFDGFVLPYLFITRECKLSALVV